MQSRCGSRKIATGVSRTQARRDLFAGSKVGTILYVGGPQGDDTFETTVALPTVIRVTGGDNSVEGGGFLNYAFFAGTGNKYMAAGTNNAVFQTGGVPVQISNPKSVPVQVYND